MNVVYKNLIEKLKKDSDGNFCYQNEVAIKYEILDNPENHWLDSISNNELSHLMEFKIFHDLRRGIDDHWYFYKSKDGFDQNEEIMVCNDCSCTDNKFHMIRLIFKEEPLDKESEYCIVDLGFTNQNDRRTSNAQFKKLHNRMTDIGFILFKKSTLHGESITNLSLFNAIHYGIVLREHPNESICSIHFLLYYNKKTEKQFLDSFRLNEMEAIELKLILQSLL